MRAARHETVHGTMLGQRTGPPIGRAFVAFAVAIAAVMAAAVAETASRFDLPGGLSSRLGVVAATVFAISGLLAGYRALATRSRSTGAIAVVLLGPGAGWCWLVFVAAEGTARPATTLVMLVTAGLAVVLFAEGLRFAHWLDVFTGLGALALGLVAAVIRSDPIAATDAATPALLAGVAGMTCLYGLLVDLEVAEHRSLVELVESKRRIEEEVARAEEVLHDLRSGLLSIEAAIGSFDGELAGPLRWEAARLRRLTVRGARQAAAFDLVSRVRRLILARQAGGAVVDLRAPVSAGVWGEESEVLAIVENLLSNAERHGGAPITVEIAARSETVTLSVSNRETRPVPTDVEVLFDRGVSTHPDGRGLGLSRARMLAAMNGADLEVDRSVRGTTTFVLALRSEPPVGAS